MNILTFVEEQHGAQVADPLVREARTRDQFQALELTKVRWVTQHVDIEELCDVPTSVCGEETLLYVNTTK